MRTVRLLNVALIGTFILTGIRVYWRSRDANRPEIPIGTKADVKVNLGRRGAVALSEVARGKCSLVVVYSPTCGACEMIAHQWRQDLISDRDPLPVTWHALWVSEVDSLHTLGFPLPGPPVVNLFAAENILSALGATATPYRLVLDPEGSVLLHDHNASLPAKGMFRNDCTISR